MFWQQKNSGKWIATRFKALENEAEDYEKACTIRAYISAIESDSTLSAEKEEWIAWAKAKADWLDPLVSAVDPFFGQRQHDKDEEYKQPKISYWDWNVRFVLVRLRLVKKQATKKERNDYGVG